MHKRYPVQITFLFSTHIIKLTFISTFSRFFLLLIRFLNSCPPGCRSSWRCVYKNYPFVFFSVLLPCSIYLLLYIYGLFFGINASQSVGTVQRKKILCDMESAHCDQQTEKKRSNLNKCFFSSVLCCCFTRMIFFSA